MGGANPDDAQGGDSPEQLDATGLAQTMVSGGGQAGTPSPAGRLPSEDATLIGSRDLAPDAAGADDTMVGEGQAARPREITQVPQRIGKYRMLRPLGEGGMGTVFAAQDEELDRKVAIKLVRPRRADGAIREGETLRLLREAKALAKISHPNVIHVYEVGTWRSRVYVAMELVDGWTLSRFQYRNVTRWEDLLEIYKSAGRGLAAAHAGGLVHRDFKPDNVLVTTQGEPRVIDFGLARTIGAGGVEEEASARPELELNEELQLTQTGVVLGTPAYMAPEQHRGEATDARTDQFSFCVALYEALYAQRPFAGSTFAELAHNVLHGEISEPPPFIKVPRWIRRVLVRGLSVDPEARYPDMETLLDALEHDPSRRWRVLGGLALSVVLIGTALLSWRAVERRSMREAEAERVRAEFDAQRLHDQELQIRAAQTRSLPARQNEFVIGAARARLAKDPTAALAVLKHLDPDDDHVVPEALALAGEALARGVTDLDIEFEAAITLVEFSRGGTHVLVGDAKGGLRLIHCGSGVIEAELRTEAPVRAAVFTAEDAQLVLGDETGHLHFFAAAQIGLAADAGPPQARGEVTAAEQRRMEHSPITALAAARAGQRIAAGDSLGLVTLWDASAAQLDRRLLSHEKSITALSFDTHENLLYTADSSGLLYARDLEQRSKWQLEREQVVDGLRVQDGRLVGWQDGQMWTWDRTKAKRFGVRTEAGAHLAVLGDAQVEVDALGTLRLREDGQITAIVEGIAPWKGPFAVTPDHKRFALGDLRGRFVLRRLGDKSGLERYGSEARPLVALALANAHPRFATSNRAGELELHDLEGAELPKLEGMLSGGAELLEFSPKDTLLFAASERLRQLWSVETGQGVELPEGRCPVKALAWAADDSRVALAECDVGGAIDVFDRAGQRIARETVTEISGVLLDGSGTQALGLSHPLGALTHLAVDEGKAQTQSLGDFAKPDEVLAGVAFVEQPGAELTAVSLGVRIATYSDLHLHVWHWDLERDQVSLLSDEPLRADPERAEQGRFLLLPIEDGLLRFWDLGRNHSVVLDDLASPAQGTGYAGFSAFDVAADRQSLLLQTPGTAEAIVHHVHLPTGAARRFSGPTPFVAISGDGMILGRRFGGIVELWRDPAPQDIEGLLEWLAEQTIRELEAAQLLGARASARGEGWPGDRAKGWPGHPAGRATTGTARYPHRGMREGG